MSLRECRQTSNVICIGDKEEFVVRHTEGYLWRRCNEISAVWSDRVAEAKRNNEAQECPRSEHVPSRDTKTYIYGRDDSSIELAAAKLRRIVWVRNYCGILRELTDVGIFSVTRSEQQDYCGYVRCVGEGMT